MKTIKELKYWADGQQAVTQDFFNLVNGSVMRQVYDTRQDRALAKERIENLGKLVTIFDNYEKYENNGLSDGITLKTLEKLRDYCRSEKEIYTARIYEYVQDKKQHCRVFMDAEQRDSFQDAEIALIMLIVTLKSR